MHRGDKDSIISYDPGLFHLDNDLKNKINQSKSFSSESAILSANISDMIDVASDQLEKDIINSIKQSKAILKSTILKTMKTYSINEEEIKHQFAIIQNEFNTKIDFNSFSKYVSQYVEAEAKIVKDSNQGWNALQIVKKTWENKDAINSLLVNLRMHLSACCKDMTTDFEDWFAKISSSPENNKYANKFTSIKAKHQSTSKFTQETMNPECVTKSKIFQNSKLLETPIVQEKENIQTNQKGCQVF